MKYGQIFYLSVCVKTQVEISLTSIASIGKLNSDVWKPESLVPITVIPDTIRGPSEATTYPILLAYLSPSNGNSSLQSRPDITMPQHQYLIGSVMYIV
jgi:hypothetical protein